VVSEGRGFCFLGGGLSSSSSSSSSSTSSSLLLVVVLVVVVSLSFSVALFLLSLLADLGDLLRSSESEVTGSNFIPFWGSLAMVEGDPVALGGGGALGGFVFFFVLVSVGGLEGDDDSVGGWGRGKWREHTQVFLIFLFF
jgi:hypothetical protein